MAADAFEKLKSSFNRGITTISVKTSSSLEKSKIKTHIESLTRDIERDIQQIGETAYKIWSDEEKDFTVLNERCAAVKSKKDEIEKLTKELESIDERDNQILGTTERPEEAAPKFI